VTDFCSPAAAAFASAAAGRVAFATTFFAALLNFGRKKPRGCIFRSERRTIFKS
jgi:hypothetical protein